MARKDWSQMKATRAVRACLLVVVGALFSAQQAEAGLSDIDKQCKKVLAFFALQTTTVDGKEAAYLGESSKKYENHLKVALTSIRDSCPSIIPVVVTINDISVETKRWITALGATVVKHELTVSEHVYKTAALEEWSWIKGVISTYLRIEVHLIVEEVKHLFDPSLVDMQYVVWADLDTIWIRSFDSCTLAKPTLLSVSGAGTSDPNAGIGYYNTTAMALIFNDMVRYAITKDFKFSALDNTLMAEFAGSKFTALPYFFNWRPYWGSPPRNQWARDAGGLVHILHVHGPKLDKAVCVLYHADSDRALQTGRPWSAEQKQRLAGACGIAHHQSGAMLAILETAYLNDKGRLYRAVEKKYNKLLFSW